MLTNRNLLPICFCFNHSPFTFLQLLPFVTCILGSSAALRWSLNVATWEMMAMLRHFTLVPWILLMRMIRQAWAENPFKLLGGITDGNLGSVVGRF